LNIEELERILTDHPWLPKPRYVYLVKAHVYGVVDGAVVVFRGATPISPRDRIALTPDADDVTVVHEVLHTVGFGELGAHLLAPHIRAFRRILPPLIKREVKYEKVSEPHPLVEVYERVA
jgi:hypothetical protein